MASFDSPISVLEEDFFDRGRVAAQVLRLITNSNPSWSTRMGLYGAWGEGKSSVLELLKELAPKKEFVLVSFTPSGIQTREELFREFMLQIGRGLKEAGVEEKEWQEGLNSISRGLEKSRAIVQSFGEVAGFESSTAKAGIGAASILLNKLLTPDSEQFKKIQDKIGDKRFIVIIDDLDRVNPELIPEILLSLRDVLDLPGFNFVLAFDYKVITKAISARNEAWGDGRRFLEKIIDYPITLSIPTSQQCGEFLRYWLDKLSVQTRGFETLEWLIENLPRNPRKLKLFIRQLSAENDSLTRLGPKDVDIRLVCLLLLVRIDYPEFMRRFLADDDAFKIMNWLGQSSYRGEESDSARNKREDIRKILMNYGEQSGLSEGAVVQAMSSIERAANYTSISSEEGLREAAGFFDEPPKMTRDELDEILAISQSSEFSGEINNHAENFGFNLEDVKAKFLELAAEKYGELLGAASNVNGSSSHSEMLDAASRQIDLVANQISSGFLQASGDVFLAFYDVMRSWAHFNGNDADRKLREKETKFLLHLLDISVNDLVSQDNRLIHALPISREMNPEANVLRDLIAQKLDHALADDLIARIERPHGIEELFNQNMSRHKSLLFDTSEALWKSKRSEMLKAINNRSPLSIENAYHWLRLLRFGKAQHLGIANELEILRGFTSSAEIVNALWQAASSEPLQFRVASEFEEIRKLLMLNNPGVDFESPEWLSVYVARLEKGLEQEGRVAYDAQQPSAD